MVLIVCVHVFHVSIMSDEFHVVDVSLLATRDQDINERRTIQEALKQEVAFFARHPSYRVISHRLGTHYLSRLLNQV